MKGIPHQDQSKLHQNSTSHSTKLIKLSAQPKYLPHQTSHNKQFHLTVLGIIVKLCSRKLWSDIQKSFPTVKPPKKEVESLSLWPGKGGERRGVRSGRNRRLTSFEKCSCSQTMELSEWCRKGHQTKFWGNLVSCDKELLVTWDSFGNLEAQKFFTRNEW